MAEAKKKENPLVERINALEDIVERLAHALGTKVHVEGIKADIAKLKENR